MRSKLNIALLVLLVIQVILVGLMYTGPDEAKATPSGPWVQLDANTLSQVTINDADGNSVTLKRVDNDWLVPAKFDFPVDQQRLQHLLQSLDAARPDLPVAVSTQARTRFHVGKGKFERHLVFKSDQGTVADLYLGKSAGAGRLYARLAGKDAIQNVRLALWRASANASDWLDKTFLQPNLGQQQQIVLPDVTLIHGGSLWHPEALADDRLPDPDKIATLIQRLRNLRWDKLVGTTADVRLAPQPTFVMTLTPKKGKPVTYCFYKNPASADTNDAAPTHPVGNTGKRTKPVWQVTRSDADFVFAVPDAMVEPLLKANRHELSMAKKKNAKHADTATASKTNAHSSGK